VEDFWWHGLLGLTHAVKQILAPAMISTCYRHSWNTLKISVNFQLQCCVCVCLYMCTHFFRRTQVRSPKTAKLILGSKSKVAKGTVNWHTAMFSGSFLEVAKFVKSKQSQNNCVNAFNTNIVFRACFLRS